MMDVILPYPVPTMGQDRRTPVPLQMRNSTVTTPDDSTFTEVDFTDAVMAEERWSKRNYDGCTFRDADLSGLHTENVTFTGCDFTGPICAAPSIVARRFAPAPLPGQACGTVHSTTARCWARSSRTVGCARSPSTRWT